MFASLLGKKKSSRLVSVDIGSSSIKMMELDVADSSKPKLLAMGSAPTPANSIANHIVVNDEKIAEAIRGIVEAGNFSVSDAVISLPGPSAFTKRASMALTPLKDLQQNIQFEASNYIPHKLESIMLDFQVLGLSSRSMMDVLLVAVRNEVIDSYVNAVSRAGLVPVIADVDYFALENMFDLNYEEDAHKTVALVNIGSRYTTVNIIQDGVSVFSGDVSLGGRLYTDALCEILEMSASDAEKIKHGKIPEGVDPTVVHETIDRTTEHVVNELHRQIGFFWNATATDRAIEMIYLCGGGSVLPGLAQEVAEKTHTACQIVDCFRKIDWKDKFDESAVQSFGPTMGVSIGLAMRRLGDKKHRLEEAANVSMKRSK